MASHVSHAALPYPIKNARYSILVPFLDDDGDPTDPVTPDTEVSEDGAGFADAGEEVTVISGSNGMGVFTFTGKETNNSAVGAAFKVASGPKVPLGAVYPRNLPILASGTASAGAAGTLTLASSITYDITNCFLRTTGGTGGGGTGGANNQARRIISYNTSTQVATVSPNWETTPDATTTYDILCPEGVTPAMLQTMNPATPGRKPVIDANGLIDALTVRVGPTGAGTTQTARDLGLALPAVAPGAANGLLIAGNNADTTFATWTVTGLTQLQSVSLSASLNITQDLVVNGATGLGSFDISGAFTATNASNDIRGIDIKALNGSTQSLLDLKDFADLGYNPTTHSVVLVDAITLCPDSAGVTTLLTRLTASRAGYLDNLDVGGPVSSQADINALNQSASRRIIMTTVGQYERPESATVTYTVETRTFDGDGAVTNADTTPTLTATGTISGNLSANLSAATNPATGVYRWTYTVSSAATKEEIRFDVSATMSTAFTLSVYSQVVDFVSATWTTADASNLTAIFNKLPVNNIADQTLLAAAIDDLPTNLELDAVVVDIAAQITTDHGAGLYTRNTEPLDAVGTRAALGMGAADLDDQLAELLAFEQYKKAHLTSFAILNETPTTAELHVWPVGTPHIEDTGELEVIALSRVDAVSPWIEATL